MHRDSIARRIVLGLLVTLSIAEHNFAGQVVNPGSDLFATAAGDAVIFGQPFVGVPLDIFDFGGTIGIQATGNTDTIIQRLNKVDLGPPPTNIKMDALQLKSVNPFGIASGPVDFYYLTLQSQHGGAESTGALQIGSTPGTFSLKIDVFFDVRRGSLTGPIVQSADTEFVASGTFSFVAPPSTILIDGVNHNLNGSNNNNDFWLDTPLELLHLAEHRPSAEVSLGNSVAVITPEPNSMTVAAGVFVLSFYWQQRRRLYRRGSDSKFLLKRSCHKVIECQSTTN